MMSTFRRAVDADSPALAVCATFADRVTVRAEQVTISPWPQTYDPEWTAWRWVLDADADAPIDPEITSFSVEKQGKGVKVTESGHPRITDGIVVETEHGFFVGWFDGDESADELCEYLWGYISDFGP